MIQWIEQAGGDEKQDFALYGALESAIDEMEAGLIDFQIPDCPLMEEGLKRIICAGGKRIRPLLAWVCWDMGGSDRLPVIPLMSMLELMHTASLIHDDIVDEAPIRRGVQTIHTTLGNRAAAMAGDYLLALAMEHLHVYRGSGINEALADVSTWMCLGEFQERKFLFDASLQSVENYYRQIRRKTAGLLAVSCYAGALAGGLSFEQAKALWCYGEQIGMAFQMKDDVLDFEAQDAFGKQRGQDLRSGIFTLPLLHAFETKPDLEMVLIAEKQNKSEAEIEELIAYVRKVGGITYIEAQIAASSDAAVRSLDILPDGEHKTILIRVAQELGKRTH